MQTSSGHPASSTGLGCKLSLLTATAIAVADMVGIGVFTSLGFQVGGDATPFSVLMLWVVGGVAAMCGALCYAELAAAFPRSGGEYNLLSRIYHPVVGFIAGWISATVGFAAPIALAALAFGEYGRTLFPGASPILLANGIVWAVALVQLTGINGSAKFQNISTILKIVLIAGLILAGLRLRRTPADLVRALGRGRELHPERGLRGQPRVRHVRLLGLERGDLHHERGA